MMRRWRHARGAIWRWVAIALAVLASETVVAETYPDRAIRIVQPFAAGGSTDVIARGIAARLQESLGHPVIVEARPGAGGIIGITSVAKSPPDGYTMLLTTGSFGANAHVARNVTYDPIKDFAPITQIAGSYGLALLTNLPVANVAELIALARTDPGKVSYAIAGIGNITHVSGRLFEERAGIKLTAVSYNTPALLTDVMTGQVGLTFNSLITAVPAVQGKQLKALAITGDKRAPALPDVPTMREAGVPGWDLASGYFGLWFPAGVARDRLDKMNREVVKVLRTPELTKLIEDNGLFLVAGTPEAFAQVVKTDYDYQGRLVDELGLRPK
jgi:tripartite-type tricarboxylate transporter receptor subunit TctC